MLQVFDWEIGKAYWEHLSFLKRSGCPSEDGACARTVTDFHDRLMAKSDLHFFLGTTFNYSFRAANPWVIIGLFPVTKTLSQLHGPR